MAFVVTGVYMHDREETLYNSLQSWGIDYIPDLDIGFYDHLYTETLGRPNAGMAEVVYTWTNNSHKEGRLHKRFYSLAL